jgi:hypothetical protein
MITHTTLLMSYIILAAINIPAIFIAIKLVRDIRAKKFQETSKRNFYITMVTIFLDLIVVIVSIVCLITIKMEIWK